jgi:uncharacterized damage-inducible protein DinB
MKAIELIRWAMQLTDQGTRRMLEDMGGDAALTQPTSKGGNHPLWVVGHLAYIEGNVRRAILGGEHPVKRWETLFASGTQPKADAAAYPPFDEVLATYRDLRARNLKLLDEIGDEGLGRTPPHVPPGFEEAMKTVGQSLLLLALHQMVHYGQIADARRVAGHKPLL